VSVIWAINMARASPFCAGLADHSPKSLVVRSQRPTTGVRTPQVDPRRWRGVAGGQSIVLMSLRPDLLEADFESAQAARTGNGRPGGTTLASKPPNRASSNRALEVLAPMAYGSGTVSQPHSLRSSPWQEWERARVGHPRGDYPNRRTGFTRVVRT